MEECSFENLEVRGSLRKSRLTQNIRSYWDFYAKKLTYKYGINSANIRDKARTVTFGFIYSAVFIGILLFFLRFFLFLGIFSKLSFNY